AVAAAVVDRVAPLRALRTLVARVELTALQDGDAQGLEVSGADRVAERVDVLALSRLISLDRHAAVPLAAFEQPHAGERDTLDAGLRAKPIDERLVQGRNPLGGISAGRRR